MSGDLQAGRETDFPGVKRATQEFIVDVLIPRESLRYVSSSAFSLQFSMQSCGFEALGYGMSPDLSEREAPYAQNLMAME